MIITPNNSFLGNIPSFSIHPLGLPLTSWEKMHRKAFRKFTTNHGFTNFRNFVDTMIKGIGKVRYFRIHVVGYFYSQPYFNKWCEIARGRDEIIFFAYVTLNELDRIDMSRRPNNLKIIYLNESFDLPISQRLDNTVHTYKTEYTIDCPKHELNAVPCSMCMKCLDQPIHLTATDWW